MEIAQSGGAIAGAYIAAVQMTKLSGRGAPDLWEKAAWGQ